MKIKEFYIQTILHDNVHFFTEDRVDYQELLKTLTLPIIWSFDEYLDAWIPAESNYEFIEWLKEQPKDIDEADIEPGRWNQLKRMNLVANSRLSIQELLSEMDQNGCVRILQLLNAEYCKDMLKNYYFRNEHLHKRWKDMEGIIRTSANNLPLMRLIHQSTQKLVNQIVPEEVKTSYSFTSCYETGTCLPAHTDRPQCVWNISFMLASDPEDADLTIWPLYITSKDATHRLDLGHGDAVIYSGVRDLHWREHMPESVNKTLGVFFHYVPVDFDGNLD